eukprot:COSAG06_NODE_47685_length_337_cov_1.088235_1_plen_67_part_01
MAYSHQKSGSLRRKSAGQRLSPIPTGRVSLDASMLSEPAVRPGTAMQNFAMGRVQALLQPLLEEMFV